jgi:hypothetical protein
MRADDGCIDHLQSRVTHSAASECLQDHIPQAAVGPPTELTKDLIPVAKFLRQIAPGRAGSHQPKHRVEHAAMIARWSATTPYQERLEIRPLIVGHQSANHGRSPQRAALNQFAIPASIDLSTRPNARIGDCIIATRGYDFRKGQVEREQRILLRSLNSQSSSGGRATKNLI